MSLTPPQKALVERYGKMSHAEVRYDVVSRKGGQRCSLCSLYRRGVRGRRPGCEFVQDPIFPGGRCENYEDKTL